MLRKSETIAELAKALAVAQGAMEAAKKDKNNPAFGQKSKYADLASIWDAVREPLAKNGLSVVQLPYTDADNRVRVCTILMHQSGQWIEADYYLQPTKQDPQGVGSAITYMKRYALTGMGVAPEDDDGNAASGRNGHVDQTPPLDRPKQANGNGNGSHAAPAVEPPKRPRAGDPEQEAKKFVADAERDLKQFKTITEVRRWDDGHREWMTRLHAFDRSMHADLTELIGETYRRLNPLGAG